MEFTALDGGVAVITLISGILAYARGFMREVLAIVAWVVAAVAAYYFAPQVDDIMPEIPVIGDFLRDSCELSLIVSFAVVFAAALLVVSIFTPLFSGAVQRSALGGIDQALGFLFGVARGLLLVAIAMVVYERVIKDESAPIPMIADSQTAKIFAQVEERLNNEIPQDVPGWLENAYADLLNEACPGSGLTTAPTSPAAGE